MIILFPMRFVLALLGFSCIANAADLCQLDASVSPEYDCEVANQKVKYEDIGLGCN